MGHKLGFVIVIEEGDLENKTNLLVESIRRHPSFQEYPIFVVQPRRGLLPSQETAALLASNNAYFLYADLNHTWRHQGLMNKVYASALVESMVEQSVETLVFLDSDTLFVAPPEGLALHEGEAAGVTHTALLRAGKVGQLADEPLSPFWRLIYDNCGVKEIPDWTVTTSVDGQRILPYFNSGVVAVRPTHGIFRKWQENVERLAQDERSQQLSRNSREYLFLEQAMFAGTLLAELSRDQIRLQGHFYNYPLPAHNLMPPEIRAARLEDIGILHYHSAFSNLYWMDDIEVSEPMASWLLSRLPFRPKLRMSRSAALYLTSHLLSRLPMRRQHHRLVSQMPGLRKTVPDSGGEAPI